MKKIKLFDPTFDNREEKSLLAVLRSKNWASGSGNGKVSKFENNFKKYVEAKSCIAVNSGTAALHLALALMDIKNKEVIIPSLSFVSTAHAVLYNGGKPIFADIDPDSLCIDNESIIKKITNKTKVILPVHFGGMSCDLENIQATCKENGITLVEDAAHAVGTTYKKSKIGSHGEAVCFSFHPVKNLSMPTGGAISLNGDKSKKYEKILKELRWCGISNRKGIKYDVKSLGWNYYMNEFSAAIGIEQLKKINYLNKIRKKIAKKYSNEINLEEKMKFIDSCSYHLFWIRVKHREKFMKKMKSQNIETGVHYNPIHLMTKYKNNFKLPITEKISKELVSIPIHANLTESDTSKIIKYINIFS
jgi:perosamine synthetase